jgi:hypothetical protein
VHIPTGYLGQLLDRGVYKMPCMGPNGEMILFAVTSEHRYVLNSFSILPWGSNLDAAAEAIWELLDRVDPLTDTQFDEVRRRRLRRR